MNIVTAHPWETLLVLLILAALAGSFLPALSLGRKRRTSPGVPIRRATRPTFRATIQGKLHLLAADATAADEAKVAQLLDLCALALAPGYDLANFVEDMNGCRDEAAGPDLGDSIDRLRGVAELGEAPVFRRGTLVGFLRHKVHEGSIVRVTGTEVGADVLLRGVKGTWSTDAPDRDLASLPRATFRMLILALLLLAPSILRAEPRTYHPEALAWVAAEPPGSPGVPTHTRLEGEVAYVNGHENDGDVHLRVCHNGRCIVAECIPGLILGYKPYHQGPIGQEACMGLHVGDRIAICGISRYDGAPGHGEMAEPGQRSGGHWEVHPVEGIEILPPLSGDRP